MSEENSTNYIVQQGDCISSIAVKTGFLWTTIWDYSANSELKNLRKDPNILHPGDIVVIPPKAMKEVDCPTEQTHKFIYKRSSTKLRLKILENDKPRGNEQYILSINGTSVKGKTKSDGSLQELIPATIKKGTLILSPGEKKERVFDLQLGSLDPKNEISGIQGRLLNLGFPVEITGELDKTTIESIEIFQEKYQLPLTGEIDDTTINKLAELYGC